MINGTRPALAFCILFLSLLGTAPQASFAHCGHASFTPNPDTPLPHKHLFQPLLNRAPPGHFTDEHQQRLNTTMERFTRFMSDDIINMLAESTGHLLKMGFSAFPDIDVTTQTLEYFYTLISDEQNAIGALAISFACTRFTLGSQNKALSLDNKHTLLRRFATLFSLDPNQGAYADSTLLTLTPFISVRTRESLFMDMVNRTLLYLRQTKGRLWSLSPFYLAALKERVGNPQSDGATYIAALRNHVLAYHAGHPQLQRTDSLGNTPQQQLAHEDSTDAIYGGSDDAITDDELERAAEQYKQKKYKKKKKYKGKRPSKQVSGGAPEYSKPDQAHTASKKSKEAP